jgi:cell fate regulator YaaT (PSP1 superfamily)
VHYFDPGGIELREGDAVIAPTPRGTELGYVMLEARELAAEDLEQPLHAVKRKATEADLRREDENRERERRVFEICAERIHEHALPMKLIEARYTFDRSRIVFCFSAEGRVDFRRLVRDLAQELKARVELHQVGVRDEAKLIGGFGSCGRPLCCATFLSTLHPVAIKMAKEQNLALNPSKISGVCGRLMCCLSYEYECYRRAKAELPRVGSTIELPQGVGKVIEVNVIKGTVTAALEDGTRVEVDAECACQCPSAARPAEGQPRQGREPTSRTSAEAEPAEPAAPAERMPESARQVNTPGRREGAQTEASAQSAGEKRPRRRSRRSRARKPKQSEGPAK